MTVRTIDDIFRDFNIDGVPASGPFNPHKPDIRDTLKKLLEGLSTFPDNRVIRLNNANEGTANEIKVTASVIPPAASYQVLYVLNVTQENTGPVTVSGAINRTLVTNTSEPVPAGYLTPGMAVLCIDTGTELRMLSYGDVESVMDDLVSRAEASEAAAELAKDQAQSAASDAVSQGNVPIYSTRNAIEALEIPAGINAFRTNGYSTVGDGGAALYKKVATEPSHAGKVQSDDGAWWEIAETEVYLKQVGAVDNSDITPILQGSVDLGRNIVVDGVYLVTDKITHNGPLNIRGLDDKSELHWPASASDGGIEITPTSWYDYIEVKGVRLTTAVVALWNAVSLDWYSLGTSNIPFFWVRARIMSNRIMGALSAGGDNDTSVGWLNGVYLNYPFSVEVMDNYIFGAWDGSYNTNGIDAFKSHAGIYVPDQSQRDTAYLRVERNSFFYSQYGVRVLNVEGFWFVDNDIQVTWEGLWCENRIRPLNQYRIFGNHIGCYNSHLVLVNGRQALIEGNELSYRYGRTDGGFVTLIVLDGVYSGAVVGNSIRGNVFNTDDVNVSGILLISNSREVGNTRRISIDANQFQNLAYAYQIRATATSNSIGPSNTFDNIMMGDGVTVDNTAIAPALMGSGTQGLPSGFGLNPALYLRNKAAGALAVGREINDGAAVAFVRSGSVVGSITLSGSATSYGTTSDASLKTDKGELSFEDAVSIIKLITVHRFDWNSTGAEDIGPFAQELYDIYPHAVLKGGWFLPKDDSSEVPEGTADAHYRPWMVDLSKLIPVMLRVMQGVLADAFKDSTS